MAVDFFYESDDDQMRDLGLNWADLLKMPVNMIPVEKLILPEMIRPPAAGNNIHSVE